MTAPLAAPSETPRPVFPGSAVRIIPDLLAERVAATPDALAYTDLEESVTWKTFSERVQALALALDDLGLEAGDTVAVLGQTSGEWALADQAILTAGGVCVGLYPTLTAGQVAYILEDSKARFVFAGSDEALRLVTEAASAVHTVETIIGWGTADPADGALSLEALLAGGADRLAQQPDRLAALEARRGPDDLALLVYTSGTTGEPKGAMLSHRNCLFELKTLQTLLPEQSREDFTVSFLPMAHVAEHVVGFYGRINLGIGTHYVGSLDSQAILEALLTVRPTVFGSVPRIFEKAYAKIRMRVAEANPRRQAIFRWGDSVGRAWSRHQRAGTTPPLSLRWQHALADRLIFRRIRAAFGGRVRTFMSGAAPIDPEILEFFHGAGMLVLEAYGLTECTGIASVNHEGAYNFGTVGQAIPNVEVRIADDGEVLVRGDNVFLGYLGKPEATREALDAEGWLHTGDLGELDAEGWLTITGRKKNIIVTSGGKNIAPARIEALLTSDPVLGPVFIVGDRHPYLTAIVSLDLDEAREAAGDEGAAPEALAAHPAVLARVRATFERANAELARYEQVRRCLVLPRELTVAAGELTPTLKLRRGVVTERCTEEIARLYAERPDAAVLELT